jgi:hypothetical protein
MACASRIHAPAPGAVRVKVRKLHANGPIAPQICALRAAFPVEKPLRGTVAAPARPTSQPLISRRNVLGCHGISSVKWGLGRPKTGSALHHSVTSVSVKKALMGLIQFPGAREGWVPTGPQNAPTVVPANAIEVRRVIPGRCEAPNPESRDSPMCNCTSEVWSFGPSRNDWGQLVRLRTLITNRASGDASRTHSAKMRGRGRRAHCADDIVKE